MVITTPEERARSANDVNEVQEGDILDIAKFNALPGPVTAKMCGGSELWIESLCVKTGLMRLDVCGKIDRCHFSEVIELIDINNCKHDPDDFWIESNQSD